jgi:hypothetical protein
MRFPLLGLLVTYARAFARLADYDSLPLQAVPLFTKPEVSTGRLVVMEEGLAVLRGQKQPFAIVSAVGPTRTGKSTILGRAFFRGEHENLFRVGSGVTSYTGGVWITSKPVEMDTGSGTVRVLFIDTEGFSGVGGLTSKTYEANLFGIVYLLSSAIIFNTMFPVDAGMVASLNAHAGHALHMLQELIAWHSIRVAPAMLCYAMLRYATLRYATLRYAMQELKDAGRQVRRRRPHLVWSVQSFNLYLPGSSRTREQCGCCLLLAEHLAHMAGTRGA